MLTYSVNWTDMHALIWQRTLGRFAGQPHVQALEIGTYEGRSAVWFMDHILTGSGSQLTCVDPWLSERLPTEQAEARFDAHVAPYGDRVRKVKSFSVPFLLQQLAAEISYDFVYVDGDHRADVCLTDMVLAWRLLKVGGLLVVDDTGEEYARRCRERGYPPPRAAARSFRLCFEGHFQLLHEGEQLIVEKLPLPPRTYVPG